MKDDEIEKVYKRIRLLEEFLKKLQCSGVVADMPAVWLVMKEELQERIKNLTALIINVPEGAKK